MSLKPGDKVWYVSQGGEVQTGPPCVVLSVDPFVVWSLRSGIVENTQGDWWIRTWDLSRPEL